MNPKRQSFSLTGLRLALATAFLSAVAGRLGLWGKYGSGWAKFVEYVGSVNWYLPARMVPPVAIIQRYLAKVNGPLLDRIDLHIEVPAAAYKDLRNKLDSETSAAIRQRVERARTIQRGRGFYNSQIPAKQLRILCGLDDTAERTLEMTVRRMNLFARAHNRILRVARRIADLDEAPAVLSKHLAEAVQCRNLDRN